MPHLALALLSLGILLIMVSKVRIEKLFKGGVIGVTLAVVVDSIGKILELYKYKKMLIPIANTIPIAHIIYVFACTILYLNYLPSDWKKRILYIASFSTAFLAVEAIMKQMGAIEYLNWNLFYSYILIFLGISIVSVITEKLSLNYPQQK